MEGKLQSCTRVTGPAFLGRLVEESIAGEEQHEEESVVFFEAEAIVVGS